MPSSSTTQPDEAESEFVQSFAIDHRKHYLVHNRTPKRIEIIDATYGQLRLPPLAQRVIKGARLAPFRPPLQRLRQRHEVRVRPYDPPRPPRRRGRYLVALLFLVPASVDALVLGTLRTKEAIIGAVLALLAAAVIAAHRRWGQRPAGPAGPALFDVEYGDVEYGLDGAFYDGDDTARRTRQSAVLIAVLLIAGVLPTIAIFMATDAKTLVFFDGGFAVKHGLESRLVGRLIQVVYTVVLSLFPALMYFQFDRQRVGTLRARWVRAIFRMDRQMTTLADVDARYGDQLAEASGYSTDSARYLGGRHSPIIVATILMSLGWTLLVIGTDSFDFAGASRASVVADVAKQASARAADAADQGSDGGARAAAAAAAADAAQARTEAARIAAASRGESAPATATTTTTSASSAPPSADSVAAARTSSEQAAAAEASVRQPFFQLLNPSPSAAGMAFLGAYFFAVYLVLRGYFRGDLRPKLYNQITARLVTVVVIAYLLNTLYSHDGESDALWTAAFLAGIVPSTVLRGIGVASAKGISHLTGRDVFATPRALTKIDGVDLYESARLESEGITDIAALARSDLVSTMISTRLPVDRLMDWVDQAILLMLLDDGSDPDKPDDRVVGLRRIGLRPASSVAAVAADAPGTDRRTAAEAALGEHGVGASLLPGLAALIESEPSIRRIEHWRESELADLDRSVKVIREYEPVPAADNGSVPANGHSASWLMYLTRRTLALGALGRALWHLANSRSAVGAPQRWQPSRRSHA